MIVEERALILRLIVGDSLRHVSEMLGDADLICFRLACTTFLQHSTQPKSTTRASFLRSLKLVKFAWEELHGFCMGVTPLLSLAAGVGVVEVVAWLRAAGCEWCAIAPARAAENGHLDVLRWLREKGCPWGVLTCYAAAGSGQLEVLRFLKQHGCPWYESTCSSAARGGHLEVLSWLRENGCPWGEQTCRVAAQEGHFQLLRWAVDHGCPCPPRLVERYAAHLS